MVEVQYEYYDPQTWNCQTSRVVGPNHCHSDAARWRGILLYPKDIEPYFMNETSRVIFYKYPKLISAMPSNAGDSKKRLASTP